MGSDGGGGQIEIQNISFYYQMRPDNIVLEDFSLTIPAGKTIALVGRSGGGKSTIIQLLLRFYDPKQGCILLDGKPYPSMKVHQLRRLFGVVTQGTYCMLLRLFTFWYMLRCVVFYSVALYRYVVTLCVFRSVYVFDLP